jgi:hypothetical protein
VLDDDSGNAWIMQQRQQLRARVVHARGNLFDHLGHLIPLTRAGIFEPLQLSFQIDALLKLEDWCIDHNPADQVRFLFAYWLNFMRKVQHTYPYLSVFVIFL